MRQSLRCGLAAFCVAAALPAAAQDAPAPTPSSRQADERPNGIALFAGLYSSDVFTDIVTSPWDTQTEDIYLLTLSYNRRLATIFRHLDIEVEGGVGRRFGDNNSFEAYAALGLRWTYFPWNRHLRTTFAVYPIGPSYVADLSASEVAKDGRSANWLNYFALELTLAAPDLPQLEVLFRLHHRSGAFGAINGSTNGADFLSVGARYRF
jgi:hypothetical protein